MRSSRPSSALRTSTRWKLGTRRVHHLPTQTRNWIGGRPGNNEFDFSQRNRGEWPPAIGVLNAPRLGMGNVEQDDGPAEAKSVEAVTWLLRPSRPPVTYFCQRHIS